MRRVIRVGCDFDGVVAYNPLRIFRAPIVGIKRRVMRVENTSFLYPSARWQQIAWKILHDSSMFPNRGVELLRRLEREKKIEVHLITGRYSFLIDHLGKWIERFKLREHFTTINGNTDNMQPHLFKERMVKKLQLDVFIEDNWDIVRHLQGATRTKVYWIYNLIDRNIPFEKKFPHLEAALRDVLRTFPQPSPLRKK